ncbi:hypothetical protein [Phytomonospora endophytica]|uniref:Uncharacterized protein n=1 Tax=Phytomonospora endophytica TaxID=714109 RepID=A0A841FTW7_9ACTN|nr:hypothetical protein [Phytomonospora endophytica]MBB6035420.1 hypothetical protein [Phytomonospora endophytica]GIG63828.1 hypothetical protein Pen01_01230 [Phytomonospora endophytica]
MPTLLAADITNDALFNGLAWSFAISGVGLMVVAAIGGKNTVGKRVFFGILGLVLLVVGLLCLGGVWNEIWIGGGKSTLCILFGPWAALIWGVVGIFKESSSGDKRDVPAPTAQQWNQQNPGAQQWSAQGQQVPQQWGQQPGAQEPGWGQPQTHPGQWGQQPGQAPQQWGQQPGAQPQQPQQPGWGQPQTPPGYQQWGQQPGQSGQQPGQPPQQGWQQYPPQA